MSRNRLFLGQVALQQSLPPLHRMAASVKEVRRQNVNHVPALDTRHLGHPSFVGELSVWHPGHPPMSPTNPALPFSRLTGRLCRLLVLSYF
jgi:hypothetical protein